MTSRSKYRRLTDLYTQGETIKLKDGSPVYVQVLNPFEMDEARHDAQVARSRIVMALKQFGSDELAKVEASFWMHGRERAIENLMDDQATELLVKSTEAIANDPDWKERLDLAERQDEIMAQPESDPERELLTKINTDYIAEVERIVEEERGYLQGKYESFTDDKLIEEYVRLYIDRRGTDLGVAEHRLTEMWYAARCCDGVLDEDGEWTHEACDGHKVRLFETKGEVRDLPDELQTLLLAAVAALNMTVREAKNSDRQASLLASSPAPSAPEESTVSIPDATPASVPGT